MPFYWMLLHVEFLEGEVQKSKCHSIFLELSNKTGGNVFYLTNILKRISKLNITLTK